jgi:hypothetical protein
MIAAPASGPWLRESLCIRPSHVVLFLSSVRV